MGIGIRGEGKSCTLPPRSSQHVRDFADGRTTAQSNHSTCTRTSVDPPITVLFPSQLLPASLSPQIVSTAIAIAIAIVSPLSVILSHAVLSIIPNVRALLLLDPADFNWALRPKPLTVRAPATQAPCNTSLLYLDCSPLSLSGISDAFQNRFPRCLSGTSDRPPRSARLPGSSRRSPLPRGSKEQLALQPSDPLLLPAIHRLLQFVSLNCSMEETRD